MTNSEQEPKDKGNEWPEAKAYKRSIRVDFAIYLAVILTVLMTVTSYIMSRQHLATVTKGITEKLLVQARAYSGPAGKLMISSAGPDVLLLNNVCKKVVSDNRDVYWAGITDQQDKFIAHSDIKQVLIATTLRIQESNASDVFLQEGEYLSIGRDTIFVVVAVMERDLKLGRLGVAASAQPIKDARSESIVTMAAITLAMMLIGIPLTMFVASSKLKPLRSIVARLQNASFDDLRFNVQVAQRNEFGYLAETLNVMGSRLNSAKAELLEKDRMSRELEIASEIQVSLLPQSAPQCSSFEIASFYQSAKEVGGDYYDFFEIDENHVGIVVADVSGKSLPGMLVMLLTRDITTRLSRSLMSPPRFLTEINCALSRDMKKGMFVTMFYGVIHKTSGLFSFASAGHNPLIVFRHETGISEILKTKGFPLGIMPSPAFEKRLEPMEVKLQVGDRILQYTDGLNEALNDCGVELGLDDFVKMAQSSTGYHSQEFLDRLMTQHRRFVGHADQYDDLTLVTLQWLGAQSVEPPVSEVSHPYAANV